MQQYIALKKVKFSTGVFNAGEVVTMPKNATKFQIASWLAHKYIKEDKIIKKVGKEDIIIELVEASPGWYNVEVGGIIVNDNKLRKKEARALAAKYE